MLHLVYPFVFSQVHNLENGGGVDCNMTKELIESFEEHAEPNDRIQESCRKEVCDSRRPCIHERKECKDTMNSSILLV